VHEALAKACFEKEAETLKDADAALRRGLILHSREYPVIDVTVQHSKPLRLRMRCDDWDDLPPSIELLNADGTPWKSGLPGGVFHGGPHKNTGLPFICMRGSREYHTHEGHLQDKWDKYRGQDGMGLVGILVQLGNAWRKAVK